MRIRTLGMLGMLGLGACGSSSGGDTSVCDALATATGDFASKTAQCFSTTPSTGITADQCRQSIGQCTDADRQKISDLATCVGALPTCTPSSLSTWQSAFQTCLGKLGGINGGC